MTAREAVETSGAAERGRSVAAIRRLLPEEVRGALGRHFLIAVPFLWLGVFFLAPFLIVLKLSFSEVALAMPPYTPIAEWVDEAGSIHLRFTLNLSNYLLLVEDSLYRRSYLNSLGIAAVSTAVTLAIGFPIAYALTQVARRWRFALLMLAILPFWTSFLIRVYAWISILKTEGFLNQLLAWLGLISEPLQILNTNWAVYLGIVYSYLPFMVLPLYASLERIDVSLMEAAADLGCRPIKAFWVITVPLALPGVVAGSLLVFIPAVGEFVIPDLLGGSGSIMIGKTLWSEFFNNRDWPLSSGVAVILLVLLVVPIVLFQRLQLRRTVG
ncbi:MAG: ABC transporter permease subunit [Alphaproteobacteria bacterium]|nr:ABC transporter permease subunit [Alphaproteobacteria bacterium]